MQDQPDTSMPRGHVRRANARSRSFLIAQRCVPCPECGEQTLLTALALAAGHEVRDEESDDWQAVEANAFLFLIAAVSPNVHGALRRAAADYSVESEAHGDCCWVNHCRHCRTVLGDEMLHGEPGAHGFVPCSEADAASIRLTEVSEPFEAEAAGYAFEPEFFASMRRC